jgi:hypothetical protein
VQRFYQDYVVSAEPTSYVTSSDLNEAYNLWCDRNDRQPLPHPNFSTEFDQLKVEKHGIRGVKYFGIALRPEIEREVEESKRLKRASRKRKSAQTQEPVADQSQAA